MIVPSVALRRTIDRNLETFFREHRMIAFNRAISQLCRFYNIRRPKIEWYEYIDWGKTAGKTYEDGQIHLVHPENWKRGRIYNSERMWIQMIYHEMGHFVFWTDAERKADVFTRRMVRGLRQRGERAARPASRRKSGSGRHAARSAAGKRIAASPRRKKARVQTGRRAGKRARA
ncbi:MAG TPA: hypothetical protein VMB26_06840 [Candidatus Binataceae bacterium]|nr:hypothetical protein [Candidatus Binataceae bacterium]